jgi:2-polyprenyl-6-methoxyphenol hydroxylase-like FAD-dependent oxidoreductase
LGRLEVEIGNSGCFDIVIIGGGLGASALAHAMAERGSKVLVLEQERRFRDRVRGEYLCPWGVAEAKELGILELLRRNCAIDLPWTELGFGPRNLVETTPQQLPGLSFSHPEMQEVLLAAAEDAGAEVRRGVTVQAIEPNEQPIVVAGRDGRTERIPARLIVAADGRSSPARKWAGFTQGKNTQPFLFAGVLLTGVSARQDMGVFIFNPDLGTLAALIPESKGRYRAYFGYPATACYRLQGSEQLALFLSESAKVAPQFAEFHAGAKSAGPLASFEGGDAWVNHPYRHNVALLGDAAATSDPSFGQGMSLTLRDARVLRDTLSKDSDWERAGNRYAEQHDAYFHNCHTSTVWFRQIFQEQSLEAAARRQRALPLIAEDLTRVPDHIFSGPEMPLDDSVRSRFFGEA